MTEKEIIERMKTDGRLRRIVCKRLFRYFFIFYFGSQMEYEFAPFHEEWFRIAQNDSSSMFVLSAFRGSAKSTVFSVAYVLWCALNGHSPFTVLVSGTTQKGKKMIRDARDKFSEKGSLLMRDFGPFPESGALWNNDMITVRHGAAMIMGASVEQTVRGLSYRGHRPSLFVADDCESYESVRTLEKRDKLAQWVSGDMIPAGDRRTKVIIIGSILHPDSLIPRLQRRIDAGQIDGIHRSYPVTDEAGNPTWPGKYPDQAAIEAHKKTGITDEAWRVEFELKPPTYDGQILRPEDIHYWDELPEGGYPIYLGTDFAFGKDEWNDYTAIVAAKLIWRENQWYLYVLPNPVNERLNGPEVVGKIAREIAKYEDGHTIRLFVEKDGQQQVFLDFLDQVGIIATGISSGGKDKRMRLSSVSPFIQNARVLFARKGNERLIAQLVYFEIERHDDLSDALVILISGVLSDTKNRLYMEITTPPPPVPKSEKEALFEELEATKDAVWRSGGDPTLQLNQRILQQRWDDNFSPEAEEMRRRLPRRKPWL